MKKGFTLLEALVVVAIIGILASLSMYVFTQVRRAARDTVRKSDLTSLSIAFRARHDVKTCDNLSDVGYYPGRPIFAGNFSQWLPVTDLTNNVNDCGAFSEFMTTIPTDPTQGATYPYVFNLSQQPPTGLIKAKHFRITARLEKTSSSQELDDFARMSTIWVSTYGGVSYPEGYNFVIGD